MPQPDPDRLIRQARELKKDSLKLCEHSRRVIEKSKYVERIFTALHVTLDLPTARKSTRAK